jgi:hypothetical protein
MTDEILGFGHCPLICFLRLPYQRGVMVEGYPLSFVLLVIPFCARSYFVSVFSLWSFLEVERSHCFVQQLFGIRRSS